MRGTMLWFNAAKRQGSIQTDEGERLRVEEHAFAPGQLLGDRCRGTVVSFDRIDSPSGDGRAIDVSVVPQPAPRRARARRR
jgi:cold shock CspA family protein